MKPFPRQEMQRMNWSPPLIEYFFQIDLAIRNGSIAPGASDDEEGSIAAIALSRSKDSGDTFEIVREIRGGEGEGEEPMQVTRTVESECPEHAPRIHELERRMRNIENEVM